MMKRSVFTLPNLLSLVRLLLIPQIVWLYCVRDACYQALLVLILSGITDLADGVIARKWDMVSDLGKILDPIADKLTQIATMFCLMSRFSYMWLPLLILTLKELLTGVMGLVAIRRSGYVQGADWHGKVTTALLYGCMGLHMLWLNIPQWLGMTVMLLCMAMMLLSGLLYWYRNLKQIRG